MSSKEIKDFRPIPDFEGLYTINKFGKIIALDREVGTMFKLALLKQPQPKITVKGKQTYAVLRDAKFKDKRVNITKIIKNIFGRQKPIIVKSKPVIKPYEYKKSPVNVNGRAGIMVEQYDETGSIKVFDTIAAAARSVCGEARKISDCCYLNRAFAYGYRWRFYKQ